MTTPETDIDLEAIVWCEMDEDPEEPCLGSVDNCPQVAVWQAYADMTCDHLPNPWGLCQRHGDRIREDMAKWGGEGGVPQVFHHDHHP